MRVVQLATADVSVRFLLLDQIRFLQGLGHDVHAICAPGPWVHEIRDAGVEVHTVDLTRRITPFTDARAFASLGRILARLRPDLAHTHTPKASLLGQYAALLARVPKRVHTIHGLYVPRGATGLRRQAFLTIERATIRPAHVILSQSREDIDTCTREHLCDPRRLRYLGNGIDVEAFRPATPEERDAARSALGIRPDQHAIGIVARLVREKGYLELFAALAGSRSQIRDAVLIVCGPPEPDKVDAIVEGDARDAGLLDEQVRFMGMRTDIARIYHALDLFVLPSHREGVPRTLMEAAASGLPAVATNIRGCREVVVDGETGLLVPVDNPAALGSAIASLVNDRARRARYGGAARAYAVNQFDQRIVFRRVGDAYAELTPPRVEPSSSVP